LRERKRKRESVRGEEKVKTHTENHFNLAAVNVLKDSKGVREGSREWESEKESESKHGGNILSLTHTYAERERGRESE